MIDPRTVLLSVPTRGQIQWATVTRLEEIRDRHHGMSPILYQPGNLSVAQTRNRIVQRFLQGSWRALAMVDDDVIPPPHFLELARHLPGHGMVGVPHPMPHPSDPSRLILGAFDMTDDGLTAANPEGFGTCDALATGAVIISRAALETIGPAPFRIDPDPSAEVTSDDFLFCADLRAAGFEIGYEIRDGWFSDHHSTVSLAPLMETQGVTI